MTRDCNLEPLGKAYRRAAGSYDEFIEWYKDELSIKQGVNEAPRATKRRIAEEIVGRTPVYTVG